ncbi:MAG: STAS domain-containing protein [Chloroflexi bacterium]|nr:STAS domain-containing protein [Chloroflexota bacterium]
MVSAAARHKLTKMFLHDRKAILDQWLQYLRKQDTNWGALIDESTLQQESQAFLDLFAKAISETEDWQDVQSSAFAPLRQYLENLADSRVIQGFTPSQTALYIFALKQAVLHVAQEDTEPKTKALTQSLLNIDLLLDKLGLMTFDTYVNHREALIAEQTAAILEMASPTLRVWDDVVLLPLVGVIDTERAQVMLDSLLNAIAETEATVAILDVTGVPVIDTQVAKHVLTAVDGAHMLGATVIITGVSVDAAKTLTKLRIDLGNVITRGTLRAGLRHALRLSGYRVEKLSSGPKRGA